MYKKMDEKKESNFQKTSNFKHNTKKLVILILLVLVLISLILGGVYYYLIKIAKIEIENITNNLENSFLEINDEFKFKDEITYEELKQKLINEDVLMKNTNVLIKINEKTLNEMDKFVFDKIGIYEIKIKVSYEYHFEKMKFITKLIEKENVIKIDIKDTEKPIISGVQDKEIIVGNEINLLEGITATDNVDGVVEILTDGEVDITKAGEYPIKVIAKDSSGNQEEMTFIVFVKEPEKELTNNNNNNGNNNNNSNNTTSTSTSGNNSSRNDTENNKANSNENPSSTSQKNPLNSKEELFSEARNAKSTYRNYINEILNTTNEYRGIDGRSKLVLNEELTTAACARAVEMAYSQNFSHTRPDGSSCFTILREIGVSYSTCGENIAKGQTSAKKAVSWWRNSAGHNANMVSADFGKIGVGVYKYNGTFYWVQLFTN